MKTRHPRGATLLLMVPFTACAGGTDGPQAGEISSVRVNARGAALLLVLLTACGGTSGPYAPGTISAKSYDLSCTSVADCVPVFEGTTSCCGMPCPNAAVRKDVLAKYSADFMRLAACPAGSSCGGQPLCPGGGRITCENGACALETSSADAATSE